MSSASTTTQHTPFGIIIRCVLALVLCLAFIPLFPQRSMAATTWSMEKSGDNYVITINTDPYFGGNQWSFGNQSLAINYADGKVASDANAYLGAIIINSDGAGGATVANAWGGSIAGASATASPGFTQYTLTVPVSFFANDDFTVTYAGKTVASSEIPGASAPAPQPVEPTEPTEPTDPIEPDTPSEPDTPADAKYEGIVIDGKFDDWGGVSKADTGYPLASQVAMVWDGDWVYLYFLAEDNGNGGGNWNSVTYAGSHGNGQYAITTDLGNQLLIHLKGDDQTPPRVDGVNGAKVAVNNKEWSGVPHMWEVAIPADQLPPYLKTISFGFYLDEPVVKDVANFQGSEDEPAGEFSGIVYDGEYEDWKYYPHTTIQYATAGTDATVVDSKGALYADEGKLYAHAVTTYPDYLRGGYEFLAGSHLRINGDSNKDVEFRYIAVDAEGNINWDPQIKNLNDGKYEFYMAATDAWGTSTNINDLNQADVIYGKIMVTIGPEKEECEYEVDIETLAKKFGIPPEDIKTFDALWKNLGDKWIHTAGTSTGPLALGLSCAAIAIGGVAVANRRRKGASGSEESQANEMV